MKLRRIALAALLSTTAFLGGCGGTDDTSDTAATTSAGVMFTPTQAMPSSCTATPSGGFGLTNVEVRPAVGHPDGAKTIVWTTNAPVPTSGEVAFTLRSGEILRGLKYLDGEVVANYVFHADTGSQDNIDAPPRVDGTSYSVFIPAIAAPKLGSTWTADLETATATTRLKSTGQCTP